MLVDWLDYFKCSLEHGSNYSNVLQRIENALIDCFGKEYKDEVIKRLKEYYLKEVVSR